MRRTRTEPVAVITDVRVSPDAEYEHRRRRYALMMGMRVVAIIAAACTYQISFWLAAAFIGTGTVLPWCAVILANDGPPLAKRVRRGSLAGSEKALTAGEDDRTVDG